METMAGASINIGMRAAIYVKPLEPDRGHAVRERPCGPPQRLYRGLAVDCRE